MLADLAQEIKTRLRTLISPKPGDEDEDPDLMAFVGAPLKPRTPLKSSSVAVQPEQ